MPKATYKIDDTLSRRIIEMSLNMSSRDISKALAAEGIKLSHVSVNNHLKETRKERAETTKAIVQEQIAKTVPQDLQILERLRDELSKVVFDDAEVRADTDAWLKATKELRATVESRLKYSGAEEDTDDNGKVNVLFGIPRPSRKDDG